MEYMILSEVSLPRLLWRAWRKKPTCVVSTRSLVNGAATGHLDRIVDKLRAKGSVTDLRKDHEDKVLYPFFADLVRCTNVFAETEAWMEETFHFDTADAMYGRYASAYRHVCCGQVFNYYETAYCIAGLEPEPEEEKISVTGGDALDATFHAYRFGETKKSFKGRLGVDRLVNAALGIGVLAYSAQWIIRHVRLRSPAPEEIFLGSDFVGSGKDNILWGELAERGKSTVVILRNGLQAQQFSDRLEGYRYCSTDVGTYSIFGALEALKELVRDMGKLSLRGNHLPSSFFRQLIVLPHRRIVYRALFNRFAFKNFWCRDEYNSYHHIRSQELRRAGAKSYGIMHGIPAISGLVHQLRHLDFDVFFVAGNFQYERYYKEKWPTHMEVRPIGTFGFTREEFWKLAEPKEKNIALFIGRIFQEDQSIAAVGALAEAFPNKKLYINVKPKDRDMSNSFGKKLHAFLETAPGNVELHLGRSYDLLFCCQYAFSDGSTLSAEALLAGLDSYIFDFQPTVWKVTDYRELPGVCVHSAEEAISRVKMAEEGTWSLPRETFPQLIDLTGRISWDHILWNMGVLSDPPEPIPHLAFAPI